MATRAYRVPLARLSTASAKPVRCQRHPDGNVSRLHGDEGAPAVTRSRLRVPSGAIVAGFLISPLLERTTLASQAVKRRTGAPWPRNGRKLISAGASPE